MSHSYDPIDTCPYDPVHRIMRSRMQYHLTKCAKNWPSANVKQCPYDARHVVNQMEYEYHLSICPQKDPMLPNESKQSEGVIKKSQILPIDTSPALLSADDIWNEVRNDSQIQSYDPVQCTENRLVTRVLIGASKSQRKKHRLQERQRIAQLVEASNMEKEEQENSPLDTQCNNNQNLSSLMKPTIIEEEEKAEKEKKCESLRPDVLPLDTSKISEISATKDSTIVKREQNSLNKNVPQQYIQKESKPRTKKKNLNHQTTFTYAAAAKHDLPNQSYVTELKKYYSEQDNNSNSSMPNRNEEKSGLQTKPFSYAAAAKNEPTNLRHRYSIEKSNNVAVEPTKRETDKEDFDFKTIQNYKDAAAHSSYDQCQPNDFDSQPKAFTYASAAKSISTNQRQKTSSTQTNYNIQVKAFSYASAARNELQPQRLNDIVNDFDEDLDKLSKTVEAVTIGKREPDNLQHSKFFNTFKGF